MEERRKFNRIAESIKINYQIIYSLGFGFDIKDGEGHAKSIDLSEGGLSFITNKSIPIESFLEVELSLEGEKIPIYIKGEVIRAKDVGDNQFDIGIKFEYQFEKDSKVLHHFMTTNNLL